MFLGGCFLYAHPRTHRRPEPLSPRPESVGLRVVVSLCLAELRRGEAGRRLGRQDTGRTLTETRFYTGVPDPSEGPSQLFWHSFWSNKIRYLRSRGVYVYRGRVNAGWQEKGVDVSLAPDLVRATYEGSAKL